MTKVGYIGLIFAFLVGYTTQPFIKNLGVSKATAGSEKACHYIRTKNKIPLITSVPIKPQYDKLTKSLISRGWKVKSSSSVSLKGRKIYSTQHFTLWEKCS